MIELLIVLLIAGFAVFIMNKLGYKGGDLFEGMPIMIIVLLSIVVFVAIFVFALIPTFFYLVFLWRRTHYVFEKDGLRLKIGRGEMVVPYDTITKAEEFHDSIADLFGLKVIFFFLKDAPPQSAEFNFGYTIVLFPRSRILTPKKYWWKTVPDSTWFWWVVEKEKAQEAMGFFCSKLALQNQTENQG